MAALLITEVLNLAPDRCTAGTQSAFVLSTISANSGPQRRESWDQCSH